MNIFQISQTLLDIYQELEENGGELTEELEANLSVCEEDFKSKIKSYTDVVKYAEGEIDTIDKEINRLKVLKEKKKNAIDRISKVIIWAVDMFGDSTKAGNKYVDYGTGKVTVRNTEKVEVNTDFTDAVVKNVFSYLNTLNYTKELEHCDSIDCLDIVTAIKHTGNPINITEDELYNIQASISLDVNLRDILYGNGLELMKHLLKITTYKAKSNISKTDIKRAIEEKNMDLHNFAEIVKNKTISIK